MTFSIIPKGGHTFRYSQGWAHLSLFPGVGTPFVIPSPFAIIFSELFMCMYCYCRYLKKQKQKTGGSYFLKQMRYHF